MNGESVPLNINDERWGGYVPLFLRDEGLPLSGDFALFFQRIAQRLERFFQYNEAGIPNLDHFGAVLESESHQRFFHFPGHPLGAQLSLFFRPGGIKNEVDRRLKDDPEVKRLFDLKSRAAAQASFERRAGQRRSGDAVRQARSGEGQGIYEETRRKRFLIHNQAVERERLTVVESLFRMLPPKSAAITPLLRDIRRFLAEADVMLDLRGDPPRFGPMEEPLLQREVLDQLLPRLSARYPERAKELVASYHAVVQGVRLDSIFSEAFKTLEEIARSVTTDPAFVFDDKHIKRHFPRLDPTIRQTLILLAAQRGDKAAHGRKAPNPQEIRYLLLAICNLALLLLDHSN